ncbi:MAG: hypothetical protein PWQ55_135 [Chloroflexota bacterium]|nr:hypothetical protein [Chloroflexota bacterium]
MKPDTHFDQHPQKRRHPLLAALGTALVFLLAALLLFSRQIPAVYAQDVQPTPSQTPDKYYADYFAHSWDIPEEAAAGNNFWIEVDLSTQTLYAYRGNQIISAFLISSGTDVFPTVTGTYQIYAKYSQYTMRGPDYDIPDVPYTMFFYKGYSIHGTYWHHNFGTEMSRGCVNMKTEEAAWIYENAPVGTYVFIHD